MNIFLGRVLGPYVSTVLTSIMTYLPPTYCQLEAENGKEGPIAARGRFPDNRKERNSLKRKCALQKHNHWAIL